MRRDTSETCDWRWRKRGSKVGHLFNSSYYAPTSLCGSIRSSRFLDTDVDYQPLWRLAGSGKSYCARCQRQLEKLKRLEAVDLAKRSKLEAEATKLAMSGIPPLAEPFKRKPHHDDFRMTEKDLENATVIHNAQAAAWGPGAINPKTARIGVWAAARTCRAAGISEEDAVSALREDFARERAPR